MASRKTAARMPECEVKRLFMVAGVKEPRWVVRAVALLGAFPADGTIRCMFCQTPVKVHLPKPGQGTDRFVSHVHKADALGCSSAEVTAPAPRKATAAARKATTA